MPLSGHSLETYQERSSHATRQGNTRSQSSQLAVPLWTDPGLKSGHSVRELLSPSKNNNNNKKQTNKKRAQEGIECFSLPPKILASE